MFTIKLNLTLKEPIVLSQSNATAGSHTSLDYIPGATILGALAAKSYKALKDDGLSLEVFHSGKVRFTNAYPNINGDQTLPIPMCFHYDKLGKKTDVRNYLIKQYSVKNDGKTVQGKQHRNGFIGNPSSPIWHTPEKTLQMKTAIDEKKGSAATGQLFGYQMIKEGTSFTAQIECDNEETANRIFAELSKQKQLYIGRSKTAQFGRVSLSVSEPQAKPPSDPPTVTINNVEFLVLWLNSDLAVYNEYGTPNLSPSLQDLGLKSNGELESSISFIRTRQFAPYNSHRRSYDLERQVLTKGSMLTYKLSEKFDVQDMNTMARGLGCFTETGLGQVVLSKELSMLKLGDIEFNKVEKLPSHPTAPKPNSDLIAYLETKHKQLQQKQKAFTAINTSIDDLKGLYQAARHYNNIDNKQAYGPSKTQWGLIRELAEHYDSDQIFNQLFDNTNALIKETDEAWSIQTGQDTFRTWLQKQIESNSQDYLRDLCSQITRNKSLVSIMEGKE